MIKGIYKKQYKLRQTDKNAKYSFVHQRFFQNLRPFKISLKKSGTNTKNVWKIGNRSQKVKSERKLCQRSVKTTCYIFEKETFQPNFSCLELKYVP